MSDYKEDTVGWHLDTLKEPLRSRALEFKVLGREARSVAQAVEICIQRAGMDVEFDRKFETLSFWTGVLDFFRKSPRSPTHNPYYHNGYKMAKECAPEPGGGIASCIATESDSVRLREATEEEVASFSPVLGDSYAIPLPPGHIDKFIAAHKKSNPLHDLYDSDGKTVVWKGLLTRVAEQEARIALLEDTLAAFIQFVNENLCDNGEFTH